MKKKVFTLLLSAALLCGAAVPAAAAEKNVCSSELLPGGKLQNYLQQYLNKYFEGQAQHKPEKPESGGLQEETEKPSQQAGTSVQQVVNLVNARRQEARLSALKSDSKLQQIAQKKAEDMAKNGYFSHTSPTYGSAFDMLKAAGYSYRTAGENIAMGQKTADTVMKGWMNSSGHRANILSSGYTKIGVGYAVNEKGTPYWVQIFAG